jgi:transposase
MEFFRAWATRQAGPHGFLAYDTTSVSTYSTQIGDAEWGYNRDGEPLTQINLGCYIDQATTLPVFYTTYPGSINDKAHLPAMMAYNHDLGVKDITFVLDRGFASTANITYMHEADLHYLLGVEARYKAARQAVEQLRPDISDITNRLPCGIYAQSVKGRFWGAPTTLHVYWNPELSEERRNELERRIQAQTEQLQRLDQLTWREAKTYSTYFTITLATDGSFTFERDNHKIRAAARDTGFFCLLTDTDLTSAQALDAYRRRDTIEKAFDDLKNHIDMKRLRTHRDQTTDGKLFCAFTALIAISQIQAKVGPALKKSKQSLSKRGVLAEMDKIKTIDAATGRRLINPATKTQRDILNALDLTEQDLKTYATTP